MSAVPAPLEALRAATRQRHARAEAALDLPARCASPGGYAAALGVLHSRHAGLERALDAALAQHPLLADWADRRGKPAWLERDLSDLGGTPPAAAPLDLPPLDGPAAVLGCLYVVEGSTLGGRPAGRQVRTALGPTAPTRFFDGYGDRTGPRWRSFCTALSQARPGTGTRDWTDSLVRAAAATFGLFEEGARRLPAPPRPVAVP